MTRYTDLYPGQVALGILFLGIAGLFGSGYYFSKSLLFLIDGVTVQATVQRHWREAVGSSKFPTYRHYLKYSFSDPEQQQKVIEKDETPPAIWAQVKEGESFPVLCLPYDSSRAIPKATIYSTLPILILSFVLSLLVLILGAVMVVAKWRAWTHRLVVTELSADHITTTIKNRKNKPRPPQPPR